MTIKKKWLLLLGAAVCLLGMIGGCSMVEKPSLTEEQQNNVVRGIIRNYDIKSIKFIKLNKDSNTGSYHLLFMINDCEKYRTGITVSEISEFDEKLDNVGLSPIGDFEVLKRDVPLDDVNDILKTIEIAYLGE